MGNEKPEQSLSPFVTMFEGFRKELDEHHDRRERIIKASRDITASSKKIIFTLQRVRAIGQAVPPFVTKSNAQYWETIEKQYKSIAADLQGLNAHRYSHNITGGNQEFMEALSFQYYLETQSLISYDEAGSKIAAMCGEAGVVSLTPEDYILGICDMTGELMRFSVTSMATHGKLPSGRAKHSKPSMQTKDQDDLGDKMDIDEQAPVVQETQKPRTVLDDLRAIRLQLEMFETPGGSKFEKELETKKMPVMRECVDKVEKALYGLTVRGSERPKGWMPDMGGERRAEVESY
ncbi:Translin [Dothidotthia symphoricarpi CBS 119687]|uniref:Translin n=1 Tax=Dothidotthia symphoricarpi CBS 119687 TaxID=1392245 RepID=A0A6A6ALJ2_9PLEO|nr:Translin [Dothidotthia symphoricarpi CBS 119687]KAF2131945.1 Translin [Dothidotthia symphoricarpi CBS 119687]